MKIIVSLTGPSGTGKTALEERLVRLAGFAKLTSVTTRPQRAGEVNGQDYYFISLEQMHMLQKTDQLVESVQFGGNHYGITVKEVEKAFAADKPVVVVVEPDGAQQIKRFCQLKGWKHLAVYVDNPLPVLVERFLRREQGTDYARLVPRLINLIQHETKWIELSMWDLVVEGFNERSELSVVDFIRLHARLAAAA